MKENMVRFFGQIIGDTTIKIASQSVGKSCLLLMHEVKVPNELKMQKTDNKKNM